MCLLAGSCINSHLLEVRPASTARNVEQNYHKYIDVRPHTVEYERMCAVLGMAARTRLMDTNLIGGNTLRVSTRSAKSCMYIHLIHLLCRLLCRIATERGSASGGSSPTKSAASATYSTSRVGRGISWNISAYDTGTWSLCECLMPDTDIIFY
jgi:hypothetical protein